MYNIPHDYIIEYDQSKNYNELNNPNYLPPYRSDYPSIYKGVQVEIQIVDHCNLNCNCCNHFSPLAEPWFIEIESFKSQIIALKNNISSLKCLLLIGGEPCLHPQLYEICQIARNILGETIDIRIITNGTIIEPIEKYKQEYLDLNIQFTFSSYMNYTKLDKIKDLQPFGKVFNTRILSKSTLVEPEGTLNGFNNFFNCIDHKLPCFTLKDFKLYICPFSAHLNIYCKKANISIQEIEWEDYLPIEQINNNLDLLQEFTFTPKNLCNYCSQDEDAYPFTKSHKDIIEFTWTLQELYFRDYKRYESIINAGKNGTFQWATNKNLNPGRVDTDFETWDFNRERLRYRDGKIDIIIPYYNESIEQLAILKQNLLKQTIIQDCIIYLISDNSNMDWGVLRIFQRTPNLHCVFLRNEIQQGPGAARNKGLQNSYNKYIFFLDADDSFTSNDALEKLYNTAQNNPQKPFYHFYTYGQNNAGRHNYLLTRNFIEEYNLQFKNIFFGEDNEFFVRMKAFSQNNYYDYKNSENLFLNYNTSKGNNITSTFFYYDPMHFSYITSVFIGIYEILTIYQNDELILDYINYLLRLFINKPQCLNNIFEQSLIFIIIYILLSYYPHLIQDKNILLLLELFNINYENNCNDISYIITFIQNHIRDNYLNHKQLQTNAIYMLQILDEVKNNVKL